MFFLSVDQPADDQGQQLAAQLGLLAVVSRATRLGGVLQTLVLLLPEADRDRGQAHQRAVAVVEAVALGREVGLLAPELVHGDLDVAAEPDRLLPAAVVESVVQPHVEQVADVFGVELEVPQQQRVGDAQSHAAVVGPNSDCSVSWLQ